MFATRLIAIHTHQFMLFNSKKKNQKQKTEKINKIEFPKANNLFCLSQLPLQTFSPFYIHIRSVQFICLVNIFSLLSQFTCPLMLYRTWLLIRIEKGKRIQKSSLLQKQIMYWIMEMYGICTLHGDALHMDELKICKDKDVTFIGIILVDWSIIWLTKLRLKDWKSFGNATHICLTSS